jgi:rhodanese-related sulfurtransferase
MALRSAGLAEQLGYRQVRVYKEGLPAWRQANLPLVVNAEYLATVLDEHHVLIDLRPVEDSRAGHIPTAVGVPSERIAALDRSADAKKRLPGLRDKRAPVILYGSDTASADDAYRTVLRWGLSNVAILDGGYAAWTNAHLPTRTGAAEEQVSFTRQPLKGSVPAEEFRRLVASGKVVVLDVREDSEVARGKIPGSVHIPLGQLSDKSDTLPATDEILIHCAAGIRAREAYIRLRVRGFTNVRFLNENILVRPDGTFCIDCDE